MNKFYKKDWLAKINRVHPPKEEQLVNSKLRLHRAERLYPFPDNFFNEFINNISQDDIRYYPYVHELKDRLAKIHNLESNNIFLNNGSSENIRIFYEAFALQNKNVLITKPCYPMHEIYAQFHNSNIIHIEYNSNKTIDYEDILNNLNTEVSCLVLANPNSPVGDILDLNKIEKILIKSNKLNVPVLIDEAYIEYADQESCIKFLKDYDNLVISRTFSKACGCAGLRIGYLLGNNEIMEVLYKFIPTYEITSLSAKFGIHLLNNYKIIDDYVKLIKDEKKIIGKKCKEYNIDVILNHINTIFIKPFNLESVIKFLDNKEVFYRTRKLPKDESDWLAIVLYPEFSKSELFKLICNI